MNDERREDVREEEEGQPFERPGDLRVVEPDRGRADADAEEEDVQM